MVLKNMSWRKTSMTRNVMPRSKFYILSFLHCCRMHLLDGCKKLGYTVFRNDFYTGPNLFHSLLTYEQTAACGTMRRRRGVPKELAAAKFKQWSEYKVMSINHKIIGINLLDEKHVTLW